MELCLSRNRDLNGNGVIDPEEIRWYLPALGKYTRMVLGRQSLKDPLLDPNDFDMTRFPGRDGDASNPWFHYVSSDGMVLLNEQGLSLERKGVEGSGWYNSAWQVRCIRNLGCNLTEVVESDPVQMAYEIDPAARTVEMTYYDQSSIRQQAMNVIPMHPITSELNLPYKKFQYAREDCTESMAGYNATLIRTTNGNGYVLRLDSKSGSGNYLQIAASDWEASNNDNSICGLYSEEADGSDRGTWRVPNQKELTIMRRGARRYSSGCRERLDVAVALLLALHDGPGHARRRHLLQLRTWRLQPRAAALLEQRIHGIPQRPRPQSHLHPCALRARRGGIARL